MNLKERRQAGATIADPATDTDTVLKLAEQLLSDDRYFLIDTGSEQHSVMLQNILRALIKKVNALE